MGLLMAMGGAVALEGAAMECFFAACQARPAPVIVLPTASALADAGSELAAALNGRGIPAQVLPVRSREQAEDVALAQAVRQAGAIFLTGGNQMRLTALLGGTALHAAMLTAWQAGAVVAGTSAGAAALSALMIAYGRAGQLPAQGMAQLAPGLGFRQDLVFDQHFRQRNRLGRLMYAVALNPGLLGVGVDENTVAVLDGQMLRVAGAGSVTLVDGRHLTVSNISEITRGALALSHVQLHFLTPGCRFDFERHTVHIPMDVLAVDG